MAQLSMGTSDLARVLLELIWKKISWKGKLSLTKYNRIRANQPMETAFYIIKVRLLFFSFFFCTMTSKCYLAHGPRRGGDSVSFYLLTLPLMGILVYFISN